MIEDLLRRLLRMPTIKEQKKWEKLQMAMMGGHVAMAEYLDMWGTVSECRQCGWANYSRCETKEKMMNVNQMKCGCGELMHDRKATKADYIKYDVDGWAFAEYAMYNTHMKLWEKHHKYIPRMTMKEFWELSPSDELPARMKEALNDNTEETT